MINAFQNIDENITIVRGDTLAFGVELYEIDEENDALQTLLNQDLDSCYFSVRKDYTNTENVFQKSLGNGVEKVETGKYRVRIAPEDTASLEVGNYYYDLEIGINGDYFTVLKGLFEIEHDITKETGIQTNEKLKSIIDGTITSVYADEINGITQIKDGAFKNCGNLVSIDIPNGVTYIGQEAFRECTRLLSVVIPDTVTNYGQSVFYHCTSLESVTLSKNAPTIKASMFQGCTALQSINVPNGVTNIQSAFGSCSQLKNIYLPASLLSISGATFNNCLQITDVTVNATTPPTITSTTFPNTVNFNIYVPAESVDAYKAASYWSSRAEYIQAIPT